MSVGACLRLPSAPQDAKVGNRAKKGNEPGYPMTRKSGRTRPAEPKEMLPPDLQLLLEEIEKEPVPEKLLALAVKLQAALTERRRRQEAAATTRQERTDHDEVEQSQ